MFDFSNFNNNLEGSSIFNVIVIALLSFGLSSLIALTYDKTSKGIERPRYFIQSLILISIPVATVMQAIGDSLARGLGMLGALAIIRFRTTLRNPRNMVFMFTSIAVGIATGVYGISISVVGTVGFCLVVLLIHFSPIHKNKGIISNLQFEMPNKDVIGTDLRDKIDAVLNDYCKEVEMIRYNVNHKKREQEILEVVVFEYKIHTTDRNKATTLVNALTKQLGLLNVKLNFRNDYEKI